MDRSQYLAAALQEMAQPPQASANYAMPAEEMAKRAKVAADWRAANPGQSYLAHGVREGLGNLQAAPGRVMGGLSNLAQLFGGK